MAYFDYAPNWGYKANNGGLKLPPEKEKIQKT